MNDKDLICSICGDLIEPEPNGYRYGHNAEPVNSGRCCKDCNSLVVIPARIAQMYGVANPPVANEK